MTNIRDVFGRNLASLLSEAGVSVTELSKQTGISRVQVHRMVAQEAFPRADALQRLCGFFDVDARILLEGISDYRERQQKERHGLEILDKIAWSNYHPTAGAESFPGV